MRDIDFMSRALALAAKARGMTSPNPLVGCVIVKDKKIISEGWHRRAGADHAEIMAINKANASIKKARGVVPVVPCCQVGRTPRGVR